MRTHGDVSSAGGLGTRDHVCWTYDDDLAFQEAALEFLEDGLRLGQRLMYVSPHDGGAMRDDLAPLGAVDRLLGAGRLHVESVSIYLAGERLPEAYLTMYAQATEQALRDGYAGLRVAADVTALVARPEHRREFARYEHLVDRYMADHPFAALCGYDRRIVGDDEGMRMINAVHPLHRDRRDDVPFSFFGDPGGLVLAGEVDVSNTALLKAALSFVRPPMGELAVDVSALDFIDAAGLGVLATGCRDWTRDGGSVVVRRAARVVERMWQLLGLDDMDGIRLD